MLAIYIFFYFLFWLFFPQLESSQRVLSSSTCDCECECVCCGMNLFASIFIAGLLDQFTCMHFEWFGGWINIENQMWRKKKKSLETYRCLRVTRKAFENTSPHTMATGEAELCMYQQPATSIAVGMIVFICNASESYGSDHIPEDIVIGSIACGCVFCCAYVCKLMLECFRYSRAHA